LEGSQRHLAPHALGRLDEAQAPSWRLRSAPQLSGLAGVIRALRDTGS
jgi:hypothetical protein